MRLTMPLLALSSLALANGQVVTGQMGDAVKNLDNPMGAVYQAAIPPGQYGNISGSVVAVSAGDQGTGFTVNFAGLPTEGGPFLYHLHVMPVPSDGNCTGTLAHLDPYVRGENDPCTSDRPETCQVGDLSGKYGKVNGTTMMRTYSDPYVSLVTDQGAFFGNRSFVIHFANKTRIACANFTSIADAGSPGMIGLNSTSPPPMYPTLNTPPSAVASSTSTSIPFMPEPSSALPTAPSIGTSGAQVPFVSGFLLLSPFVAGLLTFL